MTKRMTPKMKNLKSKKTAKPVKREATAMTTTPATTSPRTTSRASWTPTSPRAKTGQIWNVRLLRMMNYRMIRELAGSINIRVVPSIVLRSKNIVLLSKAIGMVVTTNVNASIAARARNTNLPRNPDAKYLFVSLKNM